MGVQQNLHDTDNSGARLLAGCLLAYALWKLWPNVKFDFHQMTEHGFYLDVDVAGNISEKDFSRIEAAMQATAGSQADWQPQSISEAVTWSEDTGQHYLREALGELKHQKGDIPFFSCGDFKLPLLGVDPNVCEKLKKIPPADLHFKITAVGGVYWKGDANQPQLQRLNVVVFATSGELEAYLRREEESAHADHRQIGKEHDFFVASDLIGSGLPLWPPAGAAIRRELEKLVVEEQIKRGYQNVYTQDIAQLSLYETSGHYPYYKDTMYAPLKIDDREFMLRPMSCPHHFQIYKQRPYSFRELPVRFAELAKLYRYEQSGELSGLKRTRVFTLSDAHIICRPDQVEAELESALRFIEDMAAILGLQKYKDYSYRLSLGDRRNEEKYFKDDQAWDEAEEKIRGVLRARSDKFVEAPDEAAFYGPKLDIQMRSKNGKEETAFTVQYDFVMPKRFELVYSDSENKACEAVVIHHSIIGSIERVMAFLIEFYGGRFPVWLSPCQLKVLTVGGSPQLLEATRNLEKKALAASVRVEVDAGQDSIGKKIRQSQLELNPYVLVVGEREVDSGKFSLRVRQDLLNYELAADQSYTFDEILTTISRDIADRR